MLSVSRAVLTVALLVAPLLYPHATAQLRLSEARAPAASNMRLLTLRDFGCIGDGVTDDTACLRAAGASGRHILVPNGTFSARGTVSLSAGTALAGNDPTGALLTFSGIPDVPSHAAIRLEGPRAGIEKVGIRVQQGDYRRTIDFRASQTFVRSSRIAVSTRDLPKDAWHYVLFAATDDGRSLEDIRIEDNDVTATGLHIGDCIQASNAPGIQVLHNRLHDVDSVGSDHHSWAIYVSKRSDRALVAFNEIRNDSGIGGIHFNDDPGLGGTGTCSGRRIVGNVVERTSFIGIAVDFCGSGVLVQGNSVRDTAIGVRVSGAGEHVISNNEIAVTHASTPSLSSAHEFIATASDSGRVLISGNTFGPRGIANVGLNITGAGATITGNQFGADPPPEMIVVHSGQGSIVAENFLPTAPHSGASAITVSAPDTLVANNWVGVSGAAPGVHVAASNTLLSGNTFVGPGTARACVSIASSARNVVVRGNVCSGWSMAPIIDDGQGSTIRDNVFGGKSQ